MTTPPREPRRAEGASPASGAPERLFYDGDCGVCHGSVVFVAERDPGGRLFRFAPLGGEAFEAEVPAAVREIVPDSIVVHTADGRWLMRSSAMVHILRRLGGPWAVLGRLAWLVPRPLRDWAYDRFAGIRHRLVAKPEGACPVVPPAWRGRFDP